MVLAIQLSSLIRSPHSLGRGGRQAREYAWLIPYDNEIPVSLILQSLMLGSAVMIDSRLASQLVCESGCAYSHTLCYPNDGRRFGVGVLAVLFGSCGRGFVLVCCRRVLGDFL